MKKKRIIAICAVCVILCVATVLVLTGNRGNISNVNRVVGYSALYDENSINEAFDVIEKKFAKDFEGCTLTPTANGDTQPRPASTMAVRTT